MLLNQSEIFSTIQSPSMGSKALVLTISQGIISISIILQVNQSVQPYLLEVARTPNRAWRSRRARKKQKTKRSRPQTKCDTCIRDNRARCKISNYGLPMCGWCEQSEHTPGRSNGWETCNKMDLPSSRASARKKRMENMSDFQDNV